MDIKSKIAKEKYINMNLKKKRNLYSFMTLFGFFAPAPIISVLSITAYVWFLLMLLFIILYISFKNKFIISKNFDKNYVLYFICVVISSIICIIRMPREWSYDVISLGIQFCAVFIIYLFFDVINNKGACCAFLKGVYISSVIQMIWGYLQLILWKFGIDLNSIIFGEILRMYSDATTQYTLNGDVKVSAFCWNAGNFAPLMIIGFMMSNNIYMKMAFIIISLLSGSRTLMFGIIVCVTLKVFSEIYINKKISTRQAVGILTIIVVGIVFVILNGKMISDKIVKIINSLNVFVNYYLEGSTNTHIMYLLKTYDISLKNNMLTNLFGYGPKCSGYAFTSHYNFYANIGKWCVECDYVNILWNYGYIGFMAYYIWLISNIIKCWKNNYLYFVFFSTLLVMGLMYNITFNWVNLVFIFIFIINKNEENIFDLPTKDK